MSKSPFRDAARPRGRRSATRSTRTTSPLARIAASAGAAPGSPVERLGHRSAAVALSLGLIALAGGGAVATTAGSDLASASSVEAASDATGENAGLAADAQARVKAEEVRSEASAAEAERQAADARAAEEARNADEARKAEEARAAEEARKAEEARARAAAQPVDDPAAAKAYAASRLAAYGWGQDQMSALEILWTKESGWRTTATNPTSGAYGIVQSLPATKMASVGADWQTNYRTQIEWGLNYIKERYGSPSNALSFHYANNWY